MSETSHKHGATPQDARHLQDAVESRFGPSELRETVPTREGYKGEAFWEVDVHVFHVASEAPRKVYAFLQPVQGPDERQTFVIRQTETVPDPAAAVREGISRQIGPGRS